MINDIRAMRNMNRNLFAVDPAADALAEYDPDAAKLVQAAAEQLNAARANADEAALTEADSLTRKAAAHLLSCGGSSVYVRFPVMVATRLVELEAAALLTNQQTKTADE
ncbi:hypothetical protein OG427_03035 [Streptomyces sp. NBC_00133]|uniref:hypothetical protein n=1 Tax=Streptomyces sp. NBC_00133 TaxID=2903624 RepID=UPI0032542209